MEILLGFTPEGEPIRINSAQFKRHGYIPGLSGTGKTEEMASILLQVIGAEDQRWGALLLDPIGVQVDRVLRRIPKHRRADVVYLDALDTDFPFALNPFAKGCDAKQERFVTSQMMAAFELLFEDSWDSQLEAALRNTMTTLLSGPRTLAGENWWPAFDDVAPLVLMQVVDDDGKPWYKRRITTLRDSWYASLQDAGFLQAWQFWQSFDRLTPNPQARYANQIVTKSDRVTGDPVIRNIVCQEGSIDFGEIVQEGKIVIVNLQQPILNESSDFLALLIMAKMLAAIHQLPEGGVSARPPFAIFGDEFYIWATRPFMELYRMGRNFGVSVWVGHTDRGSLRQWQKPTLANAQNSICFNLAADDAAEMARTFDATPPPANPEFLPEMIPAGRSVPRFAQDYRSPLLGPAEQLRQVKAECESLSWGLKQWRSSGYAAFESGTLKADHVDSFVWLVHTLANPREYVQSDELDFLDILYEYCSGNEVEEWARDYVAPHPEAGKLVPGLPIGPLMELATQDQAAAGRFRRCLENERPPDSFFAALSCAVTEVRTLELSKTLHVQAAEWALTQSRVSNDYFATVSHSHQRGPTLYRQVDGRPRPYSDVYLQIANELCHQPDYEARCKLTGLDKKPVEVTLRTVLLPDENPGWREDIEFFKEQTHGGYCTRADEVEEHLRRREALRRRALEEAAAADATVQEGVEGKGNGYQAEGEKLGQ